MPHLICPSCGLTSYSAAGYATYDRCPRCDVPLTGASGLASSARRLTLAALCLETRHVGAQASTGPCVTTHATNSSRRATHQAKGPNNARRRMTRRVLATAAVGAALFGATTAPASAATTATCSSGVLTVFGDAADNSISIKRDAAGKILVNNGAVAVTGGSPTVANTRLIRVFGSGGRDVITFDETGGVLPAGQLQGGAGNDTITGGSRADQLSGQTGNDSLLGKGGQDSLFGGSDSDTLTGGDANDRVFGQTGNDRMVWNPGDDTDLNEGGDATDTVQVNGDGGAEQFTATANGVRVRFDRLTPAPFSLDIGTSENLVLGANGGNDSFSATGNLAALIRINVSGGAGVDRILGSNGSDVLRGDDGDDFVDGQQGNDNAFLGAGTDTFQWDPGDGSDVVEGQDGTDELQFNGANINERMSVSANGQRVRFTRDIGSIVMDLDDVESVVARTLGGADELMTNDLSGTDLTAVTGDVGGNDGQPDNVVVNATNGDNVIPVAGSAGTATVGGLAASVSITGAVAGSDRVTVKALAGDDVIDASGVSAASALLTLDGGEDDDVVIGGQGADVLLGGPGDDVLIGGGGADVLDGGTGDNVVIQSLGADRVKSAALVGKKWLKKNARVASNGKTVVTVEGERRTLPRADLPDIARGVTKA